VLLAAIGGIGSTVPRWRSWMLPTTAVVSVLGLVSAVFATESGEGLEHRLVQSDLIEAHAEAGEATRTLSFVLAVLVIGWWLVERALHRAAAQPAAVSDPGPDGAGGGLATRTRASAAPRTAPAGLRIGSIVLAVATVLASLATAYMLYLTGDRGAKAVWGELPAAPSSSTATSS
jgi:hypothetical protein